MSDPSPDGILPFRLAGTLPLGLMAIEASAGTGKTFTLSGLAARFVIEQGFPIASLLLVTFTHAAASELSDRVRTQLTDLAAVLAAAVGGTPPPADDELAVLIAGPGVAPAELVVRLERARTAVADFDSATISTIHGFAQQMLRALGVASPRDPDAALADDGGQLLDQVCGDVLVAEALRASLPTDALDRKKISEAAAAIQGNAGVRVVPDSDDPDPLVAARRELVDRVLTTVAERRRAAKVLSFDDLLTTLRDIVVAKTPAGAAARESLRRRFRVALIDEFQDTDPVQWAIFEALFADPANGTRLVLVGDPKQAIYGFRGADIHTYQRAVSSIGDRFSLDTNWRSDKAVLSGVETLLNGLTFGLPSIMFRSVQAPPKHEHTRLAVSEGNSIAPVTVRMPLTDGDSAAPTSQRAVVADLATHLADLLQRGRVPDRSAKDPETTRSIEPRDIAVLVKGKAEAAPIQRELRRLGIDAVFSGIGSVLDSPAATQWRWLLEAVAQPFDARRARAAALSWFVGWTADRLAAATDQELGAEQEKFQRWGEVLITRGVADFVRIVRGESEVVDQVLRAVDGERNITDIDHVGELFIRTAPRNVGPAGLIRVFDQLAHASKAEGSDDPAARRIESEADAVQIMTAHVSKGLQFPVVCLPMFFKFRNPSAPYFFADESDIGGPPVRTVDIANDLEWPDPAAAEERKALAAAEEAGEQLRLLYVAMTRAEHHLAIWWTGYRGTGSSALSKLLFSREDDGSFEFDGDAVAAAKEPKGDPITPVIELLMGASSGNLSVVAVPGPHGRSPSRPPRSATGVDDLSIAVISRTLDRRGGRTSFSSLTKNTHGAAGAIGQNQTLSFADPENELATAGGTDEGPEPTDDFVAPPRRSAAVTLPLGGFRGANRFGTLVHDILEVTDFAAEPLGDHLEPIVIRDVFRSGLTIDAADLTAGLIACLESPLGDLFDGRSLRSIAPEDRLNEMRFQLNMAANRPVDDRDTSRLGDVASASASAISEVLCRHMGPADPLFPWAESLAGVLDRSTLAGHLEGFVDLIARVPNGDGTDRFIVVDYKTNNLTPHGEEPSIEHYRPDALVPAMTHNHYPLQAVLYSVALHRYLRHRIDGYRPAVNLGGIAYLFLRGMAGPDTPVADGRAHGVYAWRPADDMVEELSDLLDGRPESQT